MNSQEELIKRLTRFYREAGAEVSARPPVWMPANGTARWLQPLLASVVLVALAVGLAVTIRMVREEAHRKITPFPIPSASHSPSPSASPAPLTSWVTRRVPIGSVVAMSLDSSAVFSLYDPGPMNGRPDPAKTMLARIDRVTAAVTTAGPFPQGRLLARVGPGLWIGAAADQGTTADTQWLTLVDPVTLRVKQRIHLPGQPTAGTLSLPQITGTSDLLWLGYGQSLYRLEPTTGRILLTESLPGTATSVSIDPTGHRLYAGLIGSQPGVALVIELDASTGSRIASAPTGGADLGGPHVAAAPDGVWISYATGMLGAVEHRSATGLALLSSPAHQHTNGIRVSVFGGALWLVDGMAQQVACGDPLSGVIAASSQETLPAVVVADGNGSYLGDSDGVGFLRPDPSCPH
jgi:hypothetical protein